jgi:AraC-like DNA-binding protein
MSRSVFAGRFKSLVGETPLSYLTNWRISKAKELLTTEKNNISEVAFNVGYQSEAAFNRVFKARTGKTPAMYRRCQQA